MVFLRKGRLTRCVSPGYPQCVYVFVMLLDNDIKVNDRNHRIRIKNEIKIVRYDKRRYHL